MILLAFCAGIPFSLIFSSLSLWLGQVGIAKASITMFSWAALGYSFKYLWSPLADQLPLPILTRLLGQRRSWLLLAQLLIILAIIIMAMTDPANGETAILNMALGATLLGFSAATQDISIDAWRIEVADEKDIALLSSVYQASYRLGMLTSGFGVLFIAGKLGTTLESYQHFAWQISYLCMAGLMLIGVVTTLMIKEPSGRKSYSTDYDNKDYLTVLSVFIVGVSAFILLYNSVGGILQTAQSTLTDFTTNTTLINFIVTTLRFLLAMSGALFFGWLLTKSKLFNKGMIQEVYFEPVVDLFKRHQKHMWLLAGIICTYRISDIVMGATSNIFYQEKGFNLLEIAEVTKLFGVIVTILGAFVGGLMVIRFGLMRIMILGAILSAATNLLFMVMAGMDKNMLYLIFMILADNFAQGMALTAFIAFLSMLVNRQFTAVQYAMFSSVMTLFPKIMAGYSGAMVENMGFASFYLMTTLIGIPVVLMLVYALRKNIFDFEPKNEQGFSITTNDKKATK